MGSSWVFFPDHRNNQNIHCKDFKHWCIDRKQKFPIIPLVCISLDFCPRGLVDMFKTVEITFCLSRFATSVFYLMFSSLFHVIPCACVDFILFLFLLLSPETCTCEGGPIQSKSPPPTSQPLCLFGWTRCNRLMPEKFAPKMLSPFYLFGRETISLIWSHFSLSCCKNAAGKDHIAPPVNLVCSQ